MDKFIKIERKTGFKTVAIKEIPPIYDSTLTEVLDVLPGDPELNNENLLGARITVRSRYDRGFQFTGAEVNYQLGHIQIEKTDPFEPKHIFSPVVTEGNSKDINDEDKEKIAKALNLIFEDIGTPLSEVYKESLLQGNIQINKRSKEIIKSDKRGFLRRLRK